MPSSQDKTGQLNKINLLSLRTRGAMNSTSRLTLFFWLLIGFLLIACGPALAQKSATDEPDTVILSDTLDYNDNTRESIFTGQVVMTRGEMTLYADKLVLNEDSDGFQFGTATVEQAERVLVRNEIPENFEVIEATGLRAKYNGKTDEVEMIGQAVVIKYVCGKPMDTIRGERIKYNQKSNIYQASGGSQSAGEGGRVRSLVTPSAKSEQAVADCKQPTTNP